MLSPSDFSTENDKYPKQHQVHKPPILEASEPESDSVSEPIKAFLRSFRAFRRASLADLQWQCKAQGNVYVTPYVDLGVKGYM